jgi:hypothetical protein
MAEQKHKPLPYTLIGVEKLLYGSGFKIFLKRESCIRIRIFPFARFFI